MARDLHYLGIDRADLLAHLPVDRIVVLAAQPVVPDPRGMRNPGVETEIGRGRVLSHERRPSESEIPSGFSSNRRSTGNRTADSAPSGRPPAAPSNSPSTIRSWRTAIP